MAGVKKANRKVLKDDIKDVDWARLAAYIDGEGCIGIIPTRGQAMRRKSPNHHLKVFVANTDPRLLDWIFETVGVGMCYRLPNSPSLAANINSGKWKPRFQWWVTAKPAAQILEGCLPYFIIKREQAEIAIAFQKTKTFHGKGRLREHLPANVIQMRDEMASAIRDLKRVNHEMKEAVNG
jgi:hypothetical protein